MPFHLGSVRSSREAGNSSADKLAECTNVRALPESPTHVRSAGLAQSATGSVISVGSLSSLPAADRNPSPPGSWAKNMSAGLLFPSSKIIAATGKVLSYLTFTSIPVASSNCSTMAPTKLSFLPEYRTSSPGSLSTSTVTSTSLMTSFVTGTSTSLMTSLVTGISTATSLVTSTSLITSTGTSFSTTFTTSFSTILSTGTSTTSEPHDDAVKVTTSAATSMMPMTFNIRGLKILNSLFIYRDILSFNLYALKIYIRFL